MLSKEFVAECADAARIAHVCLEFIGDTGGRRHDGSVWEEGYRAAVADLRSRLDGSAPPTKAGNASPRADLDKRGPSPLLFVTRLGGDAPLPPDGFRR